MRIAVRSAAEASARECGAVTDEPVETLHGSRDRLSTRSLRGDEVQAIADATYRSDYPLRFECVRQAALIFERAGYAISRNPLISPLAVAPEPATVGSLIIDPLRRVVRCDGRPVELKHREFDILYLLARHPEQVFSRADLLDLVWPRDYCGDDRTVDVQVSRLRRSLALAGCRNPRLVTVQSVGYKLAT
jgi:DNA-binding response OmpR family regulator